MSASVSECVRVCASVSVCKCECVRVVVTREERKNLGIWKCCGWKCFANFVHMIVHMQLLVSVYECVRVVVTREEKEKLREMEMQLLQHVADSASVSVCECECLRVCASVCEWW